MKKLFTLIELIVVILIIGILAAIIIPNISNIKEDAKATALKADQESTQIAVDMYFLDDKSKNTPNNNEIELGDPKLIDFNELVPDYLRQKPELGKFWVDNNNIVHATLADAPNNVKINGDGKVTWGAAEGAVKYQVFEAAGDMASTVNFVGIKPLEDGIIEAESGKSNYEYQGVSGKTYFVASQDKYNNWTPAIGENYKSEEINKDEEEEITEPEIPEEPKEPEDHYIMATDDDFEFVESTNTATYEVNGKGNGYFRYTGNEEYVEIPSVIQGHEMTNYYRLFEDSKSSLKGVKSKNKNVINMSYMFYNSKATTLELDKLDTANVINMVGMFYNSSAITLDLSNFNTSNVINMSNMFLGSKATTINLSSFDTSNVINMSGMFRNSSVTALDLSNFDTSNATNMSSMFRLSNLTSLDLSSFNTSKVTHFDYMFMDSSIKTGWARTPTEANKFNNSKNIPSSLIFKVK